MITPQVSQVLQAEDLTAHSPDGKQPGHSKPVSSRARNLIDKQGIHTYNGLYSERLERYGERGTVQLRIGFAETRGRNGAGRRGCGARPIPVNLMDKTICGWVRSRPGRRK